MTDLELNIYEAERYGEIDEDTRDVMLEMVAMEYTALDSRIRDIEHQLNKMESQIKKYKKMRDTYKPGSRSYIKMNDMIGDLDNKERKLSSEYRNILGSAGFDSKFSTPHSEGKRAAFVRSTMRSVFGDHADENSSAVFTATKSGKLAKDIQREKLKSYTAKNDRLANKGKGMYKTTRGLTEESTDDLKMDIYESERYGEISIEERDELLSYLD